MAGLGQLPSYGSILGNSPGASRPRRTQGPPQQGQQQQQAPPQQGQPPTFAQMQQQGQARPAPQTSTLNSSYGGYGGQPPPQQQQPIQGQLQGAVSQALAAPSRYNLPQVQQVQSALQGQLEQQFGAQRKQLDENMAARGLSASSFGQGYQGDLAGQQANAMANMNAQLIQNQAATSAADMSASLGAGQNYQNAQNQQGLAAAGLTGNYNGQSTLGAQQLGLQSQLGLGQLGLSQGELTGNYNGQSTLGAQSLGLQSQLGLGNLGVAQQQANTQQTGTLGNLGLGQAQLQQQGSQFGQTLSQQQLQNAQQFGLSQGALTGSYGGQQTLAGLQNAQQFGLQQGGLTGTYGGQQTLDAQKAAAQNALDVGGLMGSYQGNQTLGGQQLGQNNQQFQAQLQQALQLAQMQDKTANRGVDAQAALAQNDMMMKIAQWLAAQGYPSGAGTGGGGTGGTGGGTGGPGSTGGTGGTGGGGNGGDGTNPLGPTNPLANRTAGGANNNVQVMPPGGLGGYTYTGGGQTLQNPRFGNSGFTGQFGGGGSSGQFGNSGIQYGSAGNNPQFMSQLAASLNGGGGVNTGYSGSPGGVGSMGSTAGPFQSASANQAGGGSSANWTGQNQAHPGDTAAQTYGRNTTANPWTGAGPLALGTSAGGNDPMSQYAQGKIDYGTMQQLVNQQNATSGSYGFGSGAMPNYTDDQLKQSIQGQYQSLLAANRGDTNSAAQAFLNPAGGAIDPKVAAMFRQMYGGG